MALRTKRTYQTEFPGFTLDVAIPAWLSDWSWHNNACPSFGAKRPDGYCVEVFVEHADDDKREMPGNPRFVVIGYPDGEEPEFSEATDDWAEALSAASEVYMQRPAV